MNNPNPIVIPVEFPDDKPRQVSYTPAPINGEYGKLASDERQTESAVCQPELKLIE